MSAFLRAYQVLRVEGFGVLRKKILRRLRGTPRRPTKPQALYLPSDFRLQDFPHSDAPLVSLLLFCPREEAQILRCLAALRQCTGETLDYEVILLGGPEKRDRFVGLHRLPTAPSWAAACNAGAASARGQYLVFLQTDAQVQPNWLPTLLETLVSQRAGLVGPALLDLGGRLQSAGYCFAADGALHNCGEGTDPDLPEYAYLQPVDALSSACLAIEKKRFQQLGGLNGRCASADQAAVELALRVRAAGARVCYQPLSRLVQSAMPPARLMLDPCLAHWKDRLPRPEKPRHLLVIDTYMLAPDRESGSLRMVNLFQLFQELGFQISFAAANLEAPEPYVSRLQGQGVEVLYRPQVRSIRQHLKAQGHRYAVVILSRADNAARFLALARRHCPRARIIFDTVDLHFLREMRLAALSGRKSAQRAAQKRKRQELKWIARADQTWVVSPVEKELLAREMPEASVRLVSNIHRISGSQRSFQARKGMLFIGAFAHPPNRDAMAWFGGEILPRIRAKAPDLPCWIIGADPPPAVRALASETCQILGHVPEVEPFFQRCRLSVAPLRYGAGVKGKIHQSLAHGLPVVATSQAIEGMYLQDEESVLVADDPQEFAEAVLRLHTDPALWERLSQGGLAVMEAHFSFAAARRALSELG